MNKEAKNQGLEALGKFINSFLNKSSEEYSEKEKELSKALEKAQISNPWFTQENLRFALKEWGNNLKKDKIEAWLSAYKINSTPKKVGLILAGNIPLVGFHDILCTVLSGHIPLIKMSSKDKELLPVLMKFWNEFSGNVLEYEWVDKLENFDAVIATGSNNTARYLEYYFKDYLNIIRKNRTSIALLTGGETDEELQLLAQDIFRYFGLGCRNVTRLFLPSDFDLERLFKNFVQHQDIVNHHKYANNYEYNRAIYLLNQEKFWDNHFVILKENDDLFSPLGVINFSRYQDIQEVKNFISLHREDIQCIVAKELEGENVVNFGETQSPELSTYADNVDTMAFLSAL